jgi:hypothetical protein
MTSSEEKKRIQEAQARAAEIIAREEEIKRRAAAEAITEKPPVEEESEIKFAPLPTGYKNDWNSIVEEYKKRYGLKVDERGMLIFNTPAEAIKFFTEMAKEGFSFFATRYDNNDKPTDYHVFSFGNGTLFKGTYAEIKSELLTALKNNPDDKEIKNGLKTFNSLMPAGPNPAAQMREKLNEHRTEAEEAPTNKPSAGR